MGGIVLGRDMLTGENGKSGLVSGVSEGDLGTWGERERVNVLLRYVEGDRHGEECSLSLTVDLGQSEGVSDATISKKLRTQPQWQRTKCSPARS